DTGQFPTTAAGLARTIAWVGRRTGEDLASLWVIEGVASYGAGLAATVARAGYEVVEAARMNARGNRGLGKSDPLDAHRHAAAARPALGRGPPGCPAPPDRLPRPHDGRPPRHRERTDRSSARRGPRHRRPPAPLPHTGRHGRPLAIPRRRSRHGDGPGGGY